MFSTHLDLESSATVASNSLAAELKAKGERVYNLSAGEPILPPHPAVAAAATEAIRSGKTLYPPVAGIPELRAAAAAWLNKSYGSALQSDQVLVTCGGKFAIFAALQAYLQPGDQALVIAPYWVSYPSLARLFGGEPVILPTTLESGWKVSAAQVAEACTPRTKLIIINNAANPTGVLYTRNELQAILAVAAAHNLLVVSDEVYSGLVYEGAEFVSAAAFPELADRVLIIQSFSKHFAMTGWRVGLSAGPAEIIKTLTAIQSQSTTGTSSVSQWAALGAMAQANEIIPWVRQAMQARRDVFFTAFNQLFSAKLPLPLSSLYAFIPLTALGVSETNSARFCAQALSQAHVALVPGSAFGVEGYVRASFGAPESELAAGLTALQGWLKSASV